MKSVICFLFLAAPVVFSSMPSFGQMTVDATGPVRERSRVASMGQGGGVGRKLPHQIAIAVLGGSDDKGRVEVDFTVTTVGKEGVTVPISPNAGDLEPADPKADYRVTRLSLQVIPHKRPGGILEGGAVLYGSSKLPETMVTLAPGDSIRVLTRVALPQVPPSGPDTPFVASAMLNNEA